MPTTLTLYAPIFKNLLSMFTGIIRHLGTLHSAEKKGESLFWTVHSPKLFAHSKPGDSIAVNGICLTVLATTTDTASFELGAETLRKTTALQLQQGSTVNLEFSMRIGDAFDGHFVQGHVEGRAKITALSKDGETTWLSLDLPAELARFTVSKGSISVDGVSLTVAKKVGNTISIMLLPYTVKHTAFQYSKIGDLANIETDMLARHVATLMDHLK